VFIAIIGATGKFQFCPLLT